MNNDEQALVPMGHDLPEAQGGSMVSRMEEVMEATEKMMRLQEKILQTAIALTKPQDWKDLDGKPYCTVDGCNHAASHMPIAARIVSDPKRTDLEDDEGKYYLYQCTVGVSWKFGLGEVTALGVCSSRDKLFSMRDGVRKKLSEIREESVMQKCVTNGYGKAYRALFGLSNLTWEDLEGRGIQRPEEAVRYDGKGGGKKDENPEAAEKLRDQIRAMVLEMSNQDPRVAEAELERITAWRNRENKDVPGKRNVRHITEKALPIALGKVQAEYAKWRKGQPSAPAVASGSEKPLIAFQPRDCPNDPGTRPDPKICEGKCTSRKGCPEWSDHDRESGTTQVQK